jgi:hypothetical protein
LAQNLCFGRGTAGGVEQRVPAVLNQKLKLEVMNVRILLARRISKCLAHEARVYRRALRDHLRQETSRIRKLEIRSRGLRLYAAWSATTSNVIQTHAEDWHKAALPQAFPEIDVNTPVAA